MKKLIAIILALVIVLGLCACGGKTSSGSNQTADGKTVLTVGIIPSAMVMSFDDNALTKWIEEKCNVELQFRPFAGGTDVPTQISTLIAARQELPDICIGVDLGTALKTYGDDGYIINLADYFADKEGASKIFWDRMTNELDQTAQDLVVRTMTDPDTGAIYAVPNVETSLVDKIESMAWINVEWLDKLNLEKPTNCDELVKVLRAFKTQDPNGNGKPDEIPLYGSTFGLGANVVSWLLNMFTYYNSGRMMMLDDNGKIYMPYVTDEYREGLKFINELYTEGLLSNMMFSEVDITVSTPTDGVALCGIFLGHLTCYAQVGNDVIREYEPLETWGYGIRQLPSVVNNVFITEDCEEEKRDKAFEMLMTLWSWDGSMRSRYGEYGVNWTDPDEGAKSDMGLDATYKLIADPFGKQGSQIWANSMCTFNNYAECETAQSDPNMDPWYAFRIQSHAKAYELFLKAEARNPVDKIPPTMVGTAQEQADSQMAKTNVNDYRNKAQTDFITNQNGRDIHSDASWNEYIKTLDELGYKTVIGYYQTALDRMNSAG